VLLETENLGNRRAVAGKSQNGAKGRMGRTGREGLGVRREEEHVDFLTRLQCISLEKLYLEGDHVSMMQQMLLQYSARLAQLN
jgi:hypothetical protein